MGVTPLNGVLQPASAGFRRPAKVYKLRFEDDDMAGLEVRARSVPLGQFLELGAVADATSGLAPVSSEQFGAIRDLFAGFAAALVEWNLEDETGQPVPATLEGVLAQDFEFMLAIVTAWMDAIAGVSAPLPSSSSRGLAGMEAALSLASSSTPN
jgi:hypothetical protein